MKYDFLHVPLALPSRSLMPISSFNLYTLSCPVPRSGFDTEYMVNNDEETGLISYIGSARHNLQWLVLWLI